MRLRSAPRAAVVVAVVLGTAAPAGANVAVPSDVVGPAREGAPPGAGVSPPAAVAAGRWAWPLSPVPAVEREFVAPGSAWGAGHRGIDLSGAGGASVHAVEAGTVSHVGVIAGRGTVSVLHHDGLRSTYEPVDASVRVGDVVSVGQEIGLLSATGTHCRAPCLHLGARRSDGYVDPLPLLRRPRIILLPLP